MAEKKSRRFLTATLLSGVIVLLPLAVTIWLFSFLIGPLVELLQPVANSFSTHLQIKNYVAYTLAVVLLLAIVFFIGLGVRTAVGRVVQNMIETRFLSAAPGYNLIREIVLQFFGDRPSPFSRACLVRVFNGPTLCTGFLIDNHAGGISTVFIPTGPNPTSGFVVHVRTEDVFAVDAPIQEVMKSIIACGLGSEVLIGPYVRAQVQQGIGGSSGQIAAGSAAEIKILSESEAVR